jgi:hypothetical protein
MHAPVSIDSLCNTEIDRDGTYREQLDQLGKVDQRSCQAIDLVDDNDIKLSGADIEVDCARCGEPNAMKIVACGVEKEDGGLRP